LADEELKQDPEEEQPEESPAPDPAKLESLVAQQEAELAEANARIAELEQAAADTEARLATTAESLAQAVGRYRAMVAAANPEVLEELITGDTIESIDDSLNKAKTLIGKVKQGLENQASAVKIPAGAPQRTPPDLSSLSPRDKIKNAIGGNR